MTRFPHWPMLGGVLVAVALGLGACTPDTTRARVENDFAATFANQYAQSLQRQGKPVQRPKIMSTVCHNSTNLTRDAGPGSWGCEIKYTAAGGKPQDENWLALVDALGCYQAFTQDDDKRYREITDVYSHKRILDPAGSFDGCYDVYDDRTNTSKK
jgi:hypothetical protein